MDAQQLQMVDTKDYNVDDQVLQEINNGQTDEGLAVVARHSDEDNDIEIIPIKQEKIKHNKNQIMTIVITIFIAYSVIVSTIALILALNNNSTTLPSATSCDCSLQSFAAQQDPITSGFCDLIDQCIALETAEPTKSPSLYPSNYPSEYPSEYPSLPPSKFPSTSPTNYPSNYPSESPTTSPEIYINPYSIGDFKLSFQNSDHTYWKLCDGSYLLIDGEYKSLFDAIGYTFGEYIDPITNQSFFQLPKASDSVIGIAGNNHSLGEFVGKETTSNIPYHRHFLSVWAGCNSYNVQGFTEGVGPWFASECTDGAVTESPDAQMRAGGWSGNVEPNYLSSGKTGSGNEISIMQPTNFIANLFIYTQIDVNSSTNTNQIDTSILELQNEINELRDIINNMNINNQKVYGYADRQGYGSQIYTFDGNGYGQQSILFENISGDLRANIGNMLDVNTGIFTAPITGIYTFTIGILANYSTVTDAELLFNYNGILQQRFAAKNLYDINKYLAFTGSITTQIQQNDTIDFILYQNPILSIDNVEVLEDKQYSYIKWSLIESLETIDTDLIIYNIGDYKFSFKSTDHATWKLCDGQFLAIGGKYKLLFNEIGYIFGQYIDPVTNQSFFQLPDSTDSVFGIVGSNHSLGDVIGKETTNEIPYHRHYLSVYGECNNYGTYGFSEGTGPWFASQCNNAGVTGGNDPALIGKATEILGDFEPNYLNSGKTGSSDEISIMQPTNFMGNLFINTGVNIG